MKELNIGPVPALIIDVKKSTTYFFHRQDGLRVIVEDQIIISHPSINLMQKYEFPFIFRLR